MELKQCFKKYNKNYEEFVSPVVILFGQKVRKIYDFRHKLKSNLTELRLLPIFILHKNC